MPAEKQDYKTKLARKITASTRLYEPVKVLERVDNQLENIDLPANCHHTLNAKNNAGKTCGAQCIAD